jgi:hypothetical protein
MSIRSPAASLAGIPVIQDASMEPSSLPTVATSTIKAQYSHISGPFTKVM